MEVKIFALVFSNLCYVNTTDISLIIYRAVKREDNGENNWKPDRGTIRLSGLETWGHREVREGGKRVGHNSIKQSRPAVRRGIWEFNSCDTEYQTYLLYFSRARGQPLIKANVGPLSVIHKEGSQEERQIMTLSYYFQTNTCSVTQVIISYRIHTTWQYWSIFLSAPFQSRLK